MHFCTKCQNMYYIKLSGDDGNKLIYYCRHCGNEDLTLANNKICVSKTQFKKANNDYTHFINPYTVDDPTLPRVNNMPCPNQACSTNTEDTPREVICIRYDDERIKYVYLCSTCKTAWRTNDQK